MEISQELMEIVGLLEEHEKAIGRFYLELSGQQPDLKDFWRELSDEEFEHAAKMKSLQPMIENSEMYWGEKRFNKAAINTSILYVQRQAQRASQGDMAVKEALSISLSIEKSLLENDFLRVFQGDSVNVRQILDSLSLSTKHHQQQIKNKWESYRSGTYQNGH
ncbi:MAG TPA: hypothetical protein ENN05_09835 [Deltaproteobacteria bacterium]|nr:hypothetical protein [Deltaproteobacteria bacterium]